MPVRWIRLASDFPPTLNRDDDPSTLKPNESPAVYGLNVDAPTYLARGSCPTGVSAIAAMGTGSYTAYNWYYWIITVDFSGDPFLSFFKMGCPLCQKSSKSV